MVPFLLLTIAVAGGQAAPEPAAPTARKICRSDHVVGSRVPSKRVCRTQAEWDKEGRATDSAGRIQMEQSLGMNGRMMNPGGSF